MSEMNLDLRRKYWELASPLFVECHNETHSGNYCLLSADDLHDPLPAIELDPGIAITELVRVCGEREWLWDLYACTDRKRYSCSLYQGHYNGNLAHVFGDTPAESICRALTEALRK